MLLDTAVRVVQEHSSFFLLILLSVGLLGLSTGFRAEKHRNQERHTAKRLGRRGGRGRDRSPVCWTAEGEGEERRGVVKDACNSSRAEVAHEEMKGQASGSIPERALRRPGSVDGGRQEARMQRKVSLTGEEVKELADAFIASVRQRLRLQREASYQARLDRSS